MNKNKNKLSIFIVLILGVTIFLLSSAQCIFMNKTSANSVNDIYLESISQITSVFCRCVNDKLNNYLGNLHYYTHSDVVATANEPDIIDWLHAHEQNRPSCYDYVIYVDKNGTWNSDTRGTGDVSDRAYFKEVWNNGKESVLDSPVFSRSTGKPVFHVIQTVKNAGKVYGFFGGVVPLEELIDITTYVKFGETGHAWIIDKSGVIVTHNDSKYILKYNLSEDTSLTTKTRAFFSKAKQGGTGFGVVKMQNGKDEFVFYQEVENTPMIVCVAVDADEVLDLSKSITIRTIIFSILFLIVMIVLIILVVEFALKPLNAVTWAIEGIATGDADLTRRISIKSDNEIGAVVNGFNMFVGKLHDIIKNIKDSKEKLSVAGDDLRFKSDDTHKSINQILDSITSVKVQVENQAASVSQTAGAVNQIASNISSLEQMIAGQSAQVSNASSAVEEMIGNISSVNQNVEKMSDSFELLRKSAQDGSQKQQDVNDKVSEIERQSIMLQEANQAIAAIAEQTNLLAMNAAIEAAHAGEAGKGFSVVADEIRKLSETSGSQSRTIGEQLNNIKDAIGSVVAASEDSSEAFRNVTNQIQATDELVTHIKQAMEEQQAGSQQIGEALHAMNDSTLEVKSASSEMSEGNKAILEEIKNLQDATGAIKTSVEDMSNGAEKIQQTGTDLLSVAKGLNISIFDIGTQIDKFKV